MKYAQTQQELLQWVANYYTTENRATDKNLSCKYFIEDGRRCAIGMQVNKPLAAKIEQQCTGKAAGHENVFDLLPKRMKNMGRAFLCQIQSLHDFNTNWGKNGITEIGEQEVESIIETYKLKPITYDNK